MRSKRAGQSAASQRIRQSVGLRIAEQIAEIEAAIGDVRHGDVEEPIGAEQREVHLEAHLLAFIFGEDVNVVQPGQEAAEHASLSRPVAVDDVD